MTESVPDFLQARAKRLGLYITADAADAGYEKELDLGPFLLRYGQIGYLVWGTGLPAEGIAGALDCYVRECQLTAELETEWLWADDIGWYEVIVDEARWNAATEQAWRDFGSGWRVIDNDLNDKSTRLVTTANPRRQSNR
jgi:hypothetical protein